MSDVFDLEALRQWADTPVPATDEKRHRTWNQMRSDMAAAADHIEELAVALAECRAMA